MLYQLYESQRALMAPFSEFAAASAKLYNHPLSPFTHTPLAQRVAAGFGLVHRLAKDYEKPQFSITSAKVGGVDIAVQEQVAVAKPFCRLLRFKRFTDDVRALELMKTQPTVLVVAPLSGHHATLLRDTVKSLLQDHKVYVTDWTDARMVPLDAGAFHLDDYVAYVQEFIRHIGPDVHVISVCQPTVPVLAAVSLMASAGEPTPRTMTMMGGPIDARLSPTAVNNLAMNKSYSWFETNVIYRVPGNFPGAGRRVYPGFLQHTGFVAMNPDRHLSSHYDYFRDLIRGDDDNAESHRQFYPLVDHDPKPRGGERAATPRPSIFGGAGLIVNHYGRAGNLGKQALCLGDAAAVPHVNIGWHHNTVETVGVVSRDDDPLDALGDQHGGDLRHIGGTLRVLAAGHRHGAVVQQFVGDVHTGCDRRPDRQRTGMKERAVAEILDEMPAFDERCHTDPLGPFVAHTRETDELADPLGFHERHH